MSIAAIFLFALAHAGLGQKVDPKLQEILSRIDRPYPEDRKNLEKYGDQAFKLLLPMAKVRLAEYAKARKEGNRKAEDAWGDRARAVVLPLIDCAGPGRSPEMAALYEKYPEWPSHLILPWLVDHGKPQAYWSLFQKTIAKAAKTPSSELGNYEEWAVVGLVKSNPVRAVTYLAPMLADRSVNGHLRSQIYMSLPPTRLPKALDAVRRARVGERTIMPLMQRVKLPAYKAPRTVEGVILLEWNALGSPEDVWAMQWDGKRLSNPVFTGRSNYWPRPNSGRSTPEADEHEKDMAEFKKGKSWVKDARLTRDSDGDGYTDLVEEWYGLNPNSRDTDGDGIADGIDRNPFAGRPPTTEEELAVAAVFDCYAIKSESPVLNAFVTLPQGMKPIELNRWTGLVFIKGAGFKEPTRSNALSGKWLAFREVKLSADQKSCEVSMTDSGSWYTHMVTYKLEKIGNEWFVMGVLSRGSMVS